MDNWTCSSVVCACAYECECECGCGGVRCFVVRCGTVQCYVVDVGCRVLWHDLM